MANKLKIQIATAPECVAIINGEKTPVEFVGCRNGKLLMKNLNDGLTYVLKCGVARFPNTIEYEVESTEDNNPPKVFVVSVTDSADNVTAVTPTSMRVANGNSAKFELTLAEDKTASDVVASVGELSTEDDKVFLTISNVTEAKTSVLTDAV